MDKQKKQLIALVVLIVVAGGVAAWQFGLFKGDDKPATTTDEKAATTEPTKTTGPTAATGPTQTTGQQGGKTDKAPETQTQDLDVPDEVEIPLTRYDWPVRRGGAGDMVDPRFPVFDPLRVQNIDVVDPDRKRYIEQLKADWILDGITVTVQKIVKKEPNGQLMLGESVMEPKPVYQMVPQLDDNKQPIFNPEDGKVVLTREIVYERDEEGNIVMMPQLDEFGNEMKDTLGRTIMIPKPVYEQAKDEDGNVLWNDDGSPQWVMQPKYDSQGRRVVKQLPLIVRRQVIENGMPKFDEDGNPVVVEEQVYEPELDRDGKPIIRNGEPVYKMIEKKDEDGNTVLDENGRPVMVPKPRMVPDQTPQTEVVPVTEAWFKDRIRPYREGDRLPLTRFTIHKIFLKRVYRQEGSSEFKVRSGVDLLGDTGARITIFLADDSRHD